MLEKLSRQLRDSNEEVVTDVGYESLENYLYLEQIGQMHFIKPANYDHKKAKKFQNQVGWIENIVYDSEEDGFTYAQDRTLTMRLETPEVRDGQLVSTTWYQCERWSQLSVPDTALPGQGPVQAQRACVSENLLDKTEPSRKKLV